MYDLPSSSILFLYSDLYRLINISNTLPTITWPNLPFVLAYRVYKRYENTLNVFWDSHFLTRKKNYYDFLCVMHRIFKSFRFFFFFLRRHDQLFMRRHLWIIGHVIIGDTKSVTIERANDLCCNCAFNLSNACLYSWKSKLVIPIYNVQNDK